MFSVFVRRFWLSFGAVLLLTPVKAQKPFLIPSSSSLTESSLERLEGKISQVAPLTTDATAEHNTASPQNLLSNINIWAVHGNVGVGVLDLNSGKSWFLNGKQRFPMQSVFKLPVAIAVLRLVDEGKISLDQSVTITREEFAPGWSPIIKEFKGEA